MQASWVDHGLPGICAPLEPFKKHLTILQGLLGNNLKGNHTAGYGTLSCHSSELTPVAPTIDALHMPLRTTSNISRMRKANGSSVRTFGATKKTGPGREPQS